MTTPRSRKWSVVLPWSEKKKRMENPFAKLYYTIDKWVNSVIEKPVQWSTHKPIMHPEKVGLRCEDCTRESFRKAALWVCTRRAERLMKAVPSASHHSSDTFHAFYSLNLAKTDADCLLYYSGTTYTIPRNNFAGCVLSNDGPKDCLMITNIAPTRMARNGWSRRVQGNPERSLGMKKWPSIN